MHQPRCCYKSAIREEVFLHDEERDKEFGEGDGEDNIDAEQCEGVADSSLPIGAHSLPRTEAEGDTVVFVGYHSGVSHPQPTNYGEFSAVVVPEPPEASVVHVDLEGLQHELGRLRTFGCLAAVFTVVVAVAAITPAAVLAKKKGFEPSATSTVSPTTLRPTMGPNLNPSRLPSSISCIQRF